MGVPEYLHKVEEADWLIVGHSEAGASRCCYTVATHVVIITLQFISGHRGQISLPVFRSALLQGWRHTPCCISHRHHCSTMLDTSLSVFLSLLVLLRPEPRFIHISRLLGELLFSPFASASFHVSASPSVGYTVSSVPLSFSPPLQLLPTPSSCCRCQYPVQ